MGNLIVEACLLGAVALQFQAADQLADAVENGSVEERKESRRLAAMADLLEMHAAVLADGG